MNKGDTACNVYVFAYIKDSILLLQMKPFKYSQSSLFINGRVVAYIAPSAPRGSMERAQEFKRAMNFHAACNEALRTLKAQRKGEAKLERLEKGKVEQLTEETAFKTPFFSLALNVANRLENPTNSKFMQRAVKRAKGSNGHVTKIANDGKLHGYAFREISGADIQEIEGVICYEVSKANEFEKISLSTWKAIFSSARKVLRINRTPEREGLIESIQSLLTTDFHSDLKLNQETREAFERETREAEETEKVQRVALARQVRKYLSTLHAARRADKTRKANAKFKGQLRFLRKCTRAMGGTGHECNFKETAHKNGGRNTGAIHTEIARFWDYMAEGEAQLVKEATDAFSAFESASGISLNEFKMSESQPLNTETPARQIETMALPSTIEEHWMTDYSANLFPLAKRLLARIA